ncbi:uncharacterized protein BDZ99DRAFT_96105 [Mytilinidion resinicola]|uniref:Uncharacterized protein n=1 Tax=Mytilinidion resinicola TaxID=574789 RepID=A0A6A6YD89_9PEZI|nr:uncharacterized protein BDZ99DRAFT_96105 [Mytilinidion resinicola]KAF2806493.1 hypothetical protein BDZ99DRAFT_96105 [Mytilinidion resinicola]
MLLAFRSGFLPSPMHGRYTVPLHLWKAFVLFVMYGVRLFAIPHHLKRTACLRIMSTRYRPTAGGTDQRDPCRRGDWRRGPVLSSSSLSSPLFMTYPRGQLICSRSGCLVI